MLIMGTIICGIDDSIGSPTMMKVRGYGYDPRVSQITVTTHSDDVLEDGDDRSLILTPPALNA